MSGWAADPLGLAILALVTCLAAAVNSVAGGGTILTFPALVAILPADPSRMVVANATSTIGLWPGAVAAAWAYRGQRSGQPHWARWLMLPSAAGALVGAVLILVLPPEWFRVAVPWLILLAAVLFSVQPWLVRAASRHSPAARPGAIEVDDRIRQTRGLSPLSQRGDSPEACRENLVTDQRSMPLSFECGDRPPVCRTSSSQTGGLCHVGGIADQSSMPPSSQACTTDPDPLSAGRSAGTGTPLVLACVLQFLVAVYGGYFGAGIGILMLAMLGLLGLGDIHRLNAVKNVLGMVVNGTAAALFAVGSLFGGQDVSWPHAVVMAVASVIGGLGGSHLVRRMPAATVRRMVAIIAFALAGYYFAI